MRVDQIRGWVAPAFLVLCVLLGGASGPEAGLVANAVLQGLAVLLILFSLWTRRTAPYPEGSGGLLLIGFLWLLLALLYLVPLPYGVWSALPGREPVARGLEMLGVRQPGLPVSLSPHHTISSILRLLPPTAMFLLTLQLSQSQRRRLAIIFIAVAAVSVMLGVAQMVGGPRSPMRFYEITNPGMAVGFFANGNHQATLLLCAVAFSGFLIARAGARRKSSRRGRAALVIASMIALFLVMGLGIVGSLAGYGLLIPVGVGALLLYRRSVAGKVGWRWAAGASGVFAAAVALAFLGPLGHQNLSDQVGSSPTSRSMIAATSWRAVGAHFPVGTGLGTFADIYRTFDDPFRPMTEYVNHAHNDYLELALETGLLGILLVLAFFFWLGRHGWRAWRSDIEGGNLGRAATLAIAVPMAHSLVEFPLRTSAIAAVFAMSCALLLAARNRPKTRKRTDTASELRHIEAE